MIKNAIFFVLAGFPFYISCGKQSFVSRNTRIMSLSEACRDAAKARAEVMIAFIDVFAKRVGQENQLTRAQGRASCPGSLLMTDFSEKYVPPTGTVELSVSSPNSSSSGKYGFPGGTSLGSIGRGIGSGGDGNSESLVFSIKTSVTFTLGNPVDYKCQSIYSHPFYTGEAAKLVNQPQFNELLASACQKI